MTGTSASPIVTSGAGTERSDEQGPSEFVLRSPTHVQEFAGATGKEWPSIASTIPFFGNLKKLMLDRGFNIRVNYTAETFGNVSGGVKRGAIYQGVLEMVLDADLERMAGLSGLSFHANAYQIQGRGLATCCVFSLSPISSIEARASSRLFDVWFEQKLFSDKATIKAGRLALDFEFFISDYGALFINMTLGWPNIVVFNLPSGGPVYPLATPGIRVKATPNERVTFLAALLNGDPTGAGFSGEQEIKDPDGLRFRLQDSPFLIAEFQYKYEPLAKLPGTLKIGAWEHFGKFDDQRFSTDGFSLANPDSNGQPIAHRGNFGVYGIIDQMLWRPSREDEGKGVAFFARLAASPSDRNLLDFYADGGVNVIGLIDARPNDAFGIAASLSKISSSAQGLDRDAVAFSGTLAPIRDFELVLELTYQALIIPGWIIQPDFQFVHHPGGGASDPFRVTPTRIGDAAIFGIRTSFRF